MRLNHFPTATHQQVGGQPPTTSTLQSHTPASQRPQDPTVTRHGATTAESIRNGPGEDSQGQPTIREGSWASRGSAGAEGKRCEGCSAQKTVTASGWIRPHVRCGCRPKPVPKVPTLHKNWGFTLRHRGSHSRVLSVARTGPGFKNHCKGEIPKPDQLPFSQHVLRHPRT